MKLNYASDKKITHFLDFQFLSFLNISTLVQFNLKMKVYDGEIIRAYSAVIRSESHTRIHEFNIIFYQI